MNIDKLTEKAQEAVLAAQQLAEKRNHGAVDVDHLLLALVQQQDGVVPQVLQKLSVQPERIEEQFGIGGAVTGQKAERQFDILAIISPFWGNQR